MSGGYKGDSNWYCADCNTSFSNDVPFHILYVADEREKFCCSSCYDHHLENRI